MTNILRQIEALLTKPLKHKPSPRFASGTAWQSAFIQEPVKPVKRTKRSKLNRYANTVAIDNLKEDVENYALHTLTVYYYQTSSGHWRIHLHGYGLSNDKMFYYESEKMFGLDLLNCSTQEYAGKLAKALASDIGATYLAHNHSFKGAK